jgi:zinc protease
MQKDISAMMHLLSEGSVGISKQANMDFLDSMGADLSFSKSGIICEVLEANFLPVLERIFYMIKNPTFRKNSFEKIREIILESVKKAETDPSSIASIYFWRNHFSGTIFDYGIEDIISQIKNLTLKDIVSAHSQLNPNSVIIGVTGSFNSEKVKMALSKLTKNWKQGHATKELIMPEVNHEVAADIDIELLRDQTLFYLGSTSEISMEDQDYPYLILATYIAFVGFDSRMFKIREQTGLFYSYSGGFGINTGKTFSHNFVKTKFSPSNIMAGEKAIRSMLEDLLVSGITQEELEGAKRSYYCTALEQCANNLAITISFMKKIAQNIPLELSQEIFDKIFNATVEDVNQALIKHFKPELMTKIRVGTLPKAITKNLDIITELK